ncbi:MAG: class I SAM-dependent methyltransferase [Verrucomicrobiota bacterium]
MMNSPEPQPSADTTAWRVIHDAKKGIWVDQFDGHWLVQTREGSFPSALTEMAKGRVRSIYWRPRDKAASTAPEHVWGEAVHERFEVRENGARFWIDFDSGYSCGIFLDQRLNRKRVRGRVKNGERVLNTFAYTGGFSVMAALGGAVTSTVDLSRSYLQWTWKNFELNGLDPNPHFGVRGDAFEWLGTFQRQRRRFRGIVLDPPTFSRGAGKRGRQTFQTDRDYASLVAAATPLLESGGWLLCCANTHRLSRRDFEKNVLSGVRQVKREVVSCENLDMPPEFHGDDYLKSLWVVVG